jgi:DNA polymerase elongation subunit (family B)
MTINISPETKVGKVKNYTSEEHMKSQIESYNIVADDGKQYPPMNKVTFDDFIQKMNLSVASNGVLYTQEKVGVIPEILNVWFDKRVEYKDLMKQYGQQGNDELYKFYSQRQLVQKIMLNSLYGVLGLPAFRFYDVDNAEAVTLTGQTVIKTTEMIANQYYIKNIGMKSINFIDIAKNSAVKDMSKYMSKGQVIGEFMKGTPAHVKAAITYNQLLKYYTAAFKYEPMKDGDKIKWVYLKNNPLGLQTVGLTGYNDPKEILDLVEEYIDYDLIWEKELDNKLDDFYSAMNWDKPNPNLALASQFFSF